jgi:hypothetical protein
LPDFKHKQPKWTIGSKLKERDERIHISPQRYHIPSKMVESPGKSFGLKINPPSPFKRPGPAEYCLEPIQKNNYKFSMGIRLSEPNLKSGNPGPGDYEIGRQSLECKSMIFGSGTR